MRICPTYNFLVLSLLAVAVTAGCSPLSKAQTEAVGELTFRSDTISRSPAVLFGEMSELRLERGLFYAASLTSGTARYEEVTALAETSMDDESLVRKASGYVDAFNSYVRALHSVSADARWKGLGTEIRGVGTRVDSVLYRYNRLDTGYDDIPTGYARMAGRVLAYVAEEVMQAVQGRAVRNIVVVGDTLVAASCDSLMDILRSDEMDELIRHERESLRDNYAAYLAALELRGEPVPFESDRLYVELLRRTDELPDIRNSCVSALRSFRNAHAKLAADFAAGKKEVPEELWEEVLRLNVLAAQVSEMLEN